MTTETADLVRLHDELMEVKGGIESLSEVVALLQFGFRYLQDDNMECAVSSFEILEELLNAYVNKLSEGIKTLDNIMTSKEV